MFSVPFRGGLDAGIVHQVGTGAAGDVVFRGADQELAGGVELVRVPAGLDHALSQDELSVAGFADAEAQPDIHLGADRALAHGVLGRALGGGDQVDRWCAATSRDRIGVIDRAWCLAGQFGVLIDDDEQCGSDRRRFPHPFAALREVIGPSVEDHHGVGQQSLCLLRGGGQAIDARCPRHHELGTQGHLNQAVYLQYAEHARWEIMREAGISQEEFLSAKIGPVILELTVRYRQELRAGDEVTVSCAFHQREGKTYGLHQEIRKIDGTLAAEINGVCGLLDMVERRLIMNPMGRYRALAKNPRVIDA